MPMTTQEAGRRGGLAAAGAGGRASWARLTPTARAARLAQLHAALALARTTKAQGVEKPAPLAVK